MKMDHNGLQTYVSIETKLLGLFINNNNFSWKTQIECIKSKLSSSSNAIQSVKPYVTINTLKMIYYSCFQSVMTYGLIFWGHSSDIMKIFRLQKKIIRIMIDCRSSDYEDFQVAKEDY